MRFRVGRPLLIIVVVLAAVILLFALRIRTRADYGPPVTLCPGPDQYGYTCQGGAGFAYLDATVDTMLYEDDAVTRLELPFTFVFYGTPYTELHVSSNGNLQFGNADPWYANSCLQDGPATNMGDMIAPFWDDLDLRFQGYLEYETFGTAPERIFVVEWDDVPRFGQDSEDRVTFEVQLYEKSNDLVFLYEDVSTIVGHNGSSATIGLQSELQQLALQYGCFQPVVADASRIYFPHPQVPNQELGLDVRVDSSLEASRPLLAKGPVNELIKGIEQSGASSLAQLRAHWLNQTPARLASWRWLDLAGDDKDELVLLWRGRRQNPELTQLVVLSIDPNDGVSLLLDQSLSTRQEQFSAGKLVDAADLTRDGKVDLLVGDDLTGYLMMLSAHLGRPTIFVVPERCQGELDIRDIDGDQYPEIARDGCPVRDRTIYMWDGAEFFPFSSLTDQ